VLLKFFQFSENYIGIQLKSSYEQKKELKKVFLEGEAKEA